MKKHLALASVLVASGALVPAAAHAADGQTVTALGSAQIPVKPANRHKNSAIKRAVDRAYAKAVPAAVGDAREDGERIATASGLELGSILSVDENVAQPNYFYGPPPGGRFGPDQYCGTVTRLHHVRDRHGVLHRVLRRERQCFVPDTASVTLAVTFAASPKD